MAVASTTYGTVARVQALVGDAAQDRTFGPFSVPSDSEVEGFLDDVASEIHGRLAMAGYPIETASDLATDAPRVRDWLRNCNSVGAAAMALDSFSAESIADPNNQETVATRSQRLARRYNRLLNQINGPLLARLGLGRGTKLTAGAAVGGSDRVPRFYKGWTREAQEETGSGQDEDE